MDQNKIVLENFYTGRREFKKLKASLSAIVFYNVYLMALL